ncbi:hypothetical protein [Sneathiella sp.]|uniref:hypothetical protein n=1 Tax=Sneathiella sp. TaxID=1964365 RepID=UPI002FDF9196
MTAKCTSGPWTYRLAANSYGENGAFVVVRDTNDSEQTLICHMPYSGVNSSRIEERKANARLIAAAPELVDALNVALGHLTGGVDGDWRDCDYLDLIRAALEKAGIR